MRTMITDILAQAGFEVVGEAETGTQAVEKYRQLKPDLVTMDIVMPDMAATMGYGRVADLAHRMENLLDQLRRGGKAPTDAVIQLLFRATDALEKSVTLAVAGREREADLTAILADIDRLGTKETPAPPPGRPEVSVTGEFPAAAAASGRLVNVQVRPEAPLKGGRAMLALRKAQALGKVHRVQPPAAVFESDDFDGHFVLELDTRASAEEI